MKKVSLLLLALAVLLPPLSVNAMDLSPADTESGKSAAGDFVIPKILAHHCGVKLKKTSTAKKKLKKCLEQLLKDKAGKNERKRIKAEDILYDAMAENRLETLKIAIGEKIYSSDFEEKDLKDFQDKVKGKDKSGGAAGLTSGLSQSSANVGGSGDDSAANVREDWGFVAQGDQVVGTLLNEHLNMIMATDIMNRALLYMNGLKVEGEKE